METNVSPVDPWTLAHIATGAAAGAARVPIAAYVGIAVLYELVEWTMEYPRGSRIFGTKRPESAVNVAVDFAAGAAGYALGRYARDGGAK